MKRTLFFLFAILFINHAHAQETIDLFIWAGQSNAHGEKGLASGYPADSNGLDSLIRLNYTYIGETSSGGWITMQAQNSISRGMTFGPEVTFSRKLKQNGYNPAIFKYTLGGTSIYVDWKTPGGGGHYDTMIPALNQAISALTSQGDTVNVRGFVWIQGESDAGYSERSSVYEGKLDSIIHDLRTVVGDTSLPVLLGVDEQHSRVKSDLAVLNAHEKIAYNDPNIKFTSMYGLPKADHTHLNPAGLITHGEQLFEAYQILTTGNIPNDSCVFESTGTSGTSNSAVAWGQSFKPDCYGSLDEISFGAASTISSSFTVKIRNGGSCDAIELHSQQIPSIISGMNTVALSSSIPIDKDNTYYLEIISDDNTPWKVIYNNNQQPTGQMWYTSGTSNCGTREYNRDMVFSATISTLQLPIELEAFRAKTVGKSQARLTWTTASEWNNSHFNVQSSVDGVEFKNIGSVAGAGNSASKTGYEYVDGNRGRHKALYYRLEQVDYDGTTTLYGVERVVFQFDDAFVLYPNPASKGGRVTVIGGDIQSIEVLDMFGRRVFGAAFDNVPSMELPTESFPKGIYTMVVNGDASLKLVVD